MEVEEERLSGFTITLGITEAVGSLAVILVIIWTSNYRGGFSWTSNLDTQFNWHPLLMTIGMIFLYGNSILVYRALRDRKKKQLKLAHMILHVTAFVLAVIALQAVFDTHNLKVPPVPNMYTLHSWVGLVAIILFACQWVAGLVTFMFPGLHSMLRAAYLPVHVFFGLSGFVLAVVAALLGISEKAIWTLASNYSNLPSEGILVNSLGISLIIFASLVMYLVTESRFKRQPIPEDELLINSSYQ